MLKHKQSVQPISVLACLNSCYLTISCRLVLSRIIGDYLFKCPNSRFASLLAAAGAPVFHYEFALPTRAPGFPCCDGLSCHTCELPYVFNQVCTLVVLMCVR